MIYDSAILYEVCMRTLYGRGFEERYSAVALEIPDAAEVLDLCCGDCRLYRKYLKARQIAYTGVDHSRAFANNAAKDGIRFKNLDLMRADIPASDYIVMMASLYQFYSRSRTLLNKLLHSARKKVILTEPVVNLASSKIPVLASLAKKLSRSTKRFDRASFDAFLAPYEALIIKKNLIAQGREVLVVLDAAAYVPGLFDPADRSTHGPA